MAPEAGEISPYLYQFLLSQVPGQNKAKRTTTANLRPGKVKPGLFSAQTARDNSAFGGLQAIGNSIAASKANADAMFSIKSQKKAEAAAQLAYQKQQAALNKKLLELAKAKNNPAPPSNFPIYPGGGSGSGGGGYIPLPPPNAKPILPPLVAKPPGSQRDRDMNQFACDKYGQCPPGYVRRTKIIAPEKDKSLLDRLKDLF